MSGNRSVEVVSRNNSGLSNSGSSSTAVRTFTSRDFHNQQKSPRQNQTIRHELPLPPKPVPKCPMLNKKKNNQSHSGNNMNKSSCSGFIKRSSSKVGLDELDTTRRSYGDFHDIIVHMELYGKPIESVYDGVHDGPLLGTGVTGEVRQVKHRATGAQYAVKCLNLSRIETEEALFQLKSEISIMCQLDHPHIVRLEEVYESDTEIYLIQELCEGGDLFDRLDDQTDGIYTEARCASLVRQMLCALRYLHSKGIVHRDVKLENFLFCSDSYSSNLHMIDFGLAKHFVTGQRHDEAKGTPYTVAPEVISGDYDEKCDVWSIGVLTFLLLSGNTPFGGARYSEPLCEVRHNILNCNYSFDEDHVWDDVSDEAKDFIKCLLVLDPEKRPNPAQCQNHPWLRQQQQNINDPTYNHHSNTLNPNVVKSLIEFKEYSTMQRVLSEVLSYTLLPGQIADLKEEFLKIDVDGTGEISFEDLKRVLQEGASAGSLGELSEQHIRQIFDSLRIHNTDARIHWHEFIAAELKMCQVDERNMRRAFDRLDYDHKGFITLDNLKDLMGNSTVQETNSQYDNNNDTNHNREETWERIWEDAIQLANCPNPDQLTYNDFLSLVQSANYHQPPSNQLETIHSNNNSYHDNDCTEEKLDLSTNTNANIMQLQQEVTVPTRSSATLCCSASNTITAIATVSSSNNKNHTNMIHDSSLTKQNTSKNNKIKNNSLTRKPKKRHHIFSLKGLKARLHLPGNVHLPTTSSQTTNSRSSKSKS